MELTEAVETQSHPLETTAPDAGVDDLQPLREHLSSREIVALGESTHGTREFFQLKHRLCKFLVTHLGYRVIGLETNFSETCAINEYVVSGEGDPSEALTSLHFPTWETEELLEFVEWLRTFNEGRPTHDRIACHGFDAQYTSGPARAVVGYLDVVDPTLLAEVREPLRMLENEGLDTDDRNVFSSRLEETEHLLETLRSTLQERADDYGAATSVRAWHLARHHVRIVEQVAELERIDVNKRPGVWYETRDRAMAENVLWIREHEGTDKAVLWAHNGHVAKGVWQGLARTMGAVLSNELGDRYYALGFDFGRGSFQAMVPRTSDGEYELRECSVDRPPRGAAGTEFENVESPLFFLEIGTASEDPQLADLLRRERPFRSVGSVFDPSDDHDEYAIAYTIEEEFDGLLFVAKTSGTVPIGES